MPELISLPKMAIEVAIFAVLIYLVLRFLRETRGSGVVRGLGLILVAGFVLFQLLIQVLKLERLELLFSAVVQSVVIALVVVFHPEIRRAIVHLGDSPIFGRFFPKESKIVQRVLRAVSRLSKERIGALIAIERDASLHSLVESGITIDAELNSFLIESIFYPKNALHDGAIVVRNDRIVAASCLLPLSQNPDVDKRLGTRHRAALGLSEETDALAIVVSEETGKISVALGGKLYFDLSLEQLERHIDEGLGLRQQSSRVDRRRRSLWTTIAHDPWRKLAALVLGVGLYYVLDSEVRDTMQVDMMLQVTTTGAAESLGSGNRLLISLPTDRLALRNFIDAATGQVIENRQVQLSISGPNFEIDAMRAMTMSLPVTLPNVDWERNDSAEFTIADVRRTLRQLNDPEVSIAMQPPRVRIVVERMDDAEVKLHPDRIEVAVDSERLRARLRLNSAEFSRDFARVVGRANELVVFRADERPFVVRLSARSNDRQVTADVMLHQRHQTRGLRIDPACTMTVPLSPEMQEFTFILPVRTDDLSLPAEQRGMFRPDVDELEVRIKAGGALLTTLISRPEQAARWARQHMRLGVSLQPRIDGTAFPDEFPLQARLELTGSTLDQFDPAEYALAETVTVQLRRRP